MTQPHPVPQPPTEGPVQLALQLLQAGFHEADIVDHLVNEGVDRAWAMTIVQLMASRQQREALACGQRDMLAGALWFILGAVATGGTYYFSAPGSSFWMAWGDVRTAGAGSLLHRPCWLDWAPLVARHGVAPGTCSWAQTYEWLACSDHSPVRPVLQKTEGRHLINVVQQRPPPDCGISRLMV